MSITSALTPSLLARVKKTALEFGFDHCSATPAKISERDKESYLAWCANGYAADMAYMTREPDKRLRIQTAFPGAQTVLTLGVSYFQGPLPEKPGPDYGRVARYAWGLDYHEVIQERLQRLLARLKDEVELPMRPALAIDSKPLLERALAQSAAMGFMGKNTVLIVPRAEAGEAGSAARFHVGSWIFLAEILLDVPLEQISDPVSFSGCGGCTKCLNACPTGAFEGPYRLRADKCIAYLTIENKGWIPIEMRPRIGDWIFGCDVCQDVCPFNARAFETRWPEFRAENGAGAWVSLKDILSVPDPRAFKAKWGRTPFSRAKRKGLLRNACVVAGNSGDDRLLPFLEPLRQDPEPLLRGHALWAMSRLAPGRRTRGKGEEMLRHDADPEVQAECRLILEA